MILGQSRFQIQIPPPLTNPTWTYILTVNPLMAFPPNFKRKKEKKPQRVPHLLRKEQQATPDFITDSMMQLAITEVQLWFC